MRNSRHIMVLTLLTAAVVSGSAGSRAIGRPQVPPAPHPDVAELKRQLVSGGPAEQIEAAVQLGALGPRAMPAVDELTDLLNSDNEILQYECLLALGHIGPMAHDAVDRLTGLLSSQSPLLLSAALDALRRIGAASPVATEKIHQLCSSDDHAVAIAAIRCRVMTEGIDKEVVQKSIPRLAKALSDTRAEIRNEAAVALPEIGAAAVPAVSALLSGTDPPVRLKACDVLADIGPEAAAAVPKLLSLLNDPDPLVVRAAANAIGGVHDDFSAAFPALQKLLKSDSVPIRISAVRAIAQFGHEAGSAAEVILPLLSAEAIVVRAAAATALGDISQGQPEVTEALLKALSDSSGTVTVRAANSLVQIGRPAIPGLKKLLADSNYRKLAIELLGDIGANAEDAVPALVDVLHSETEDAELRREVFIALAAIGPKAAAATPAMMQILPDPKAGDSRAGAAYVLAKIGAKDSLPELRKILNSNESETVLRTAAWAIVTLDPQNPENVPVVMPRLRKAVADDDPLARKEAITALAALGPLALDAVPELIEHAQHDAVPGVRGESLHALAEIKAPVEQALPVAIAALEDSDAVVRNSARYLLGRLGKDAHGAVPRLRETLRRGDKFERVMSAWALVHIQPSAENTEVAVPLLLTVLRHPNPRVREEACITLGEIGGASKDVLHALESLRADEDLTVREAAIKALSTLPKG